MAKVNVSAKTSAVSLSPFARVVRTLIQGLLAFGAAEPTLIGLVHLSGAQASEFAGITAGLVFTVSAVQNLLEHFNVLPTVGGKATLTSTP